MSPTRSVGVAVILACGWLPATQAADDGDVIRVIAAGEGVDGHQALRQAFENAVWQAVKPYVGSDKKLDALGHAVQEISTFSNGYISWYVELKRTDAAGGRKRVQIAADVVRGRTVARLSAAGFTAASGASLPFDGTGLYAREVTGEIRRQEETRLLTQLFALAPTPVELVRGVQVRPTENEPRKTDEGVYACRVRYRIEYDFSPLLSYNKWLGEVLTHAKIERHSAYSPTHWTDIRFTNLDGERPKRVRYELGVRVAEHEILRPDRTGLFEYGHRGGFLALLTDYESLRAPAVELDRMEASTWGHPWTEAGQTRTTWVAYATDPQAIEAAVAAIPARRTSRLAVRALGRSGETVLEIDAPWVSGLPSCAKVTVGCVARYGPDKLEHVHIPRAAGTELFATPGSG